MLSEKIIETKMDQYFIYLIKVKVIKIIKNRVNHITFLTSPLMQNIQL